ncbi:MAG: sulfatase-like hydrolase/transferase, partial [Armatimonadetes bacterium]|nr:sulfatase-like hydrolase/transferase [Armatimonadota bacterium]NIM24574.1 sulfatase-like hydrolase/transferase [Armatimonadota bacterium]NIM68450.1 sulfatase-like hydrolase/transferase [Armatimonadota bacterium]NIM76836.1 sulfatase-like hydrolase/transferase [Armatimonadota bacterium]NIN06647.1 sulfatase-like hydrolase/transferase [Armatimonadota bacterium]
MLRKRLIAAIAIIVVAVTLAFIVKVMRDRTSVAGQAINLAVKAELSLPARRNPVLIKSYDFNRPADLEGWEVHTPKGPDRMWVAEGALHIRGEGVERSRIQNICSLDTAEVNVIELRVRRPVRRLWAAWRLESGEWSPGFAGHRITTQEEWFTVSIPVGQSEFWTGNIQGLWITFWSEGQPAEIEVDWIHLLRDENPSFTVRPERLGYAIADEFQWVIPTEVPGKFQRELEVPKGAKLSFSCGLSKETWQSNPAEVMVQVSVTTEQGQTQTLASGRLQPRALRGPWGWVKGTVDLEGLAGRRVTLTFESTSADEGSAAVVMWGNPTLEPPAARTTKTRPNIIVILIDALRPDHLGMYGYEKPTSPNLDELAKEAVIFENAFAQSHSTRLSVASLFSSLFPLESKEKATGYYDLKQNITTLAERLEAAGYVNAALSANRLVHWDYAFDQGFDTFYSFHSGFPAQSLTDKTLEWLKGNSRRPFFIYLHYMDTHALYQPPKAFRSRFLPADYHPPDPAVVKSDLRVMRDKMAKGHTYSAGDQEYLKGLYDGTIAS